METKNRVNRIRQHLLDNQKTYLVGAGCLAAGYFFRKPPISIVNFIAETPIPDSSVVLPKDCAIWVADHVLDEIKTEGLAKVTMESGEVLKLVYAGSV